MDQDTYLLRIGHLRLTELPWTIELLTIKPLNMSSEASPNDDPLATRAWQIVHNRQLGNIPGANNWGSSTARPNVYWHLVVTFYIIPNPATVLVASRQAPPAPTLRS